AQSQVHYAECGQVDQAGLNARFLADALVLANDLPTSRHHDELVAIGATRARAVGDARVLDRKRRGFLHLPANQLIEIITARRRLIEANERDLPDQIGHDQRHTTRAYANAVAGGAERPNHDVAVGHIDRHE